MYGIRILGAATAFTVVLLEVYSGVIQGPTWWALPGGLVLALLIALSLNAQPQGTQGPGGFGAIAQLILILALAFGMSYFSNYFGREFVPDLLSQRGWTPPQPWPPAGPAM